MKVLVTGGQGFLGSYVVRELYRQMHRPVIFDRHHGAARDEFILGDIRDATAVTEAVSHVGGVIHLAGVLGTQETILDPMPAAETNLLGGLNVLQACTAAQVPLVNIGVGNWFEHNTYSITKHTIERFTQMYQRYRSLTACTVRAVNAYGPGQSVAAPYGNSRVRKVVPSFIARALHGEPIQVYGDGLQVMDMVYAEDVAYVLVAALEHIAEHGAQPGLVFEAGTGRRTTVKDLAEIVKAEVHDQAGITPEIVNVPMRSGETPGVEVLADPTSLGALGVRASEFRSLEAGIKETVTYYRSVFR